MATSLTFALLKLAPGDPYSSYAESNISPALIHELRVAQGYDRPVVEQYLRWMGRTARGNLGYSVSLNQRVSTLIRNTLPRTLWLMSLALIASIVAGMAVGSWQGMHDGRRSVRAVDTGVMLAYSIPDFLIATILQLVFGLWLAWFSVTSNAKPTDRMFGTWHFLLSLVRNIFLPWLALTVIGTAVFARYQRVAMRDIVNETFVRSARAKGVPEHAVRWHHIFRIAVLPVVTVAGLWFPALLAGAVFVEQVFGWPGMGQLLVKAIHERDYDVVSGCVIIGSAMTALGSLLADVTREALDPRLHS